VKRTRVPRPLLLLCAAAGLFTGAALVGTILAGIALPLSLAFTGLLVVAALTVVVLRTEPDQRRLIVSITARGVLIALVATALYDVSRLLLMQLDPSPFDAFVAWPIFGHLLLGLDAPEDLARIAGLGFHVANGVTFGLAYCFLFGARARRSLRGALGTGVVWGLFLEAFQLTIFPGWLNVTTYQEFATITFLGHVVYGASLGLLARRLLPAGMDDEDAAIEEEKA